MSETEPELLKKALDDLSPENMVKEYREVVQREQRRVSDITTATQLMKFLQELLGWDLDTHDLEELKQILGTENYQEGVERLSAISEATIYFARIGQQRVLFAEKMARGFELDTAKIAQGADPEVGNNAGE